MAGRASAQGSSLFVLVILYDRLVALLFADAAGAGIPLSFSYSKEML
jgi:hypothetical protein